MKTAYLRHTNLISKLDGVRDMNITVGDMDAIVEFSFHSQKRGTERDVLETALVFMIQRAFHQIIDLKHGERFILKDQELNLSMVGGIHVSGYDIVISIVSAVDDAAMRNPHGTLEIAI